MQSIFRLVTKTAASETAIEFIPKSSALVRLPFTPGADHFFEIWTDAKKDDGSDARPYMVRMRYDHPLDNGHQPESLAERSFDLTVGGVSVTGVKLTGARWPIPMDRGEWWIRNRFSNSSVTIDVNFALVDGDPETVVEVEQWKGAHFRAPADSIKPAQSSFEIERGAAGRVTRGGFNAASAWSETGEYRVRHSSGARWLVKVKPAAQFKAIPIGEDLAPFLKDGARLVLRSGVYKLSAPVAVKNVVVIGNGADTVIEWTGADTYPGTKIPVTAIRASDSAFHGFTIDSTRRYSVAGAPGSDSWKLEKEQRPWCFSLENDCVVMRVRMIDWNRGCAMPGGYSRRLVQSCWFSPTTRTYCIWYEGSDVVVYDNTATNSIFEHICRGGPSNPGDTYGGEYAAFDGNIFSNIDNRPTDPNDDGKGTIVVQAWRYVYRSKNVLTGLGGPSGVGPLSVGAGAPAHQRTKCVVVDNDIVSRPVEIWPGAEDVLVINTPIAPRMPHELTGPKADPRRIERLTVTGYTLTRDQLAIINTAAQS